MEQFPLGETNKKTSWVTLLYQANKKKPTSKQVGEAETQSHHKPHPHVVTHRQEETCKYTLLPEKWKLWIPCLAPQFLRLAPEIPNPKTSSFGSQWSLHTHSPQQFLKGLHAWTHPSQGPEDRQPTMLWKVSRLSLKEVYLFILRHRSERWTSNLTHI